MRSRADIDDRYQWNPTRVYDSPADFERALETTDRLAADLRADLESIEAALAGDDPPGDGRTADHPDDPAGALADALERFETLVRRRQRLVLYAELGRSYDVTDDAARRRHERARSVATELEAVETALRRLLRTRAGRIERLRADRETDPLAPFDRYLADAARMPGGEPGVESLLARFSDVFESHARIFDAITDEDLASPTVEGPTGEARRASQTSSGDRPRDGDPVEVTWSNRFHHYKHPDRAFRRRVYRAFHDAVADHGSAIATTAIERMRTQAAVAEARGFDSTLEMALNKPSYPETGLRISLPTAVHDRLRETVRANLEPYHRLLERRRDRLGVETLRPWDTAVALADAPEPEIPYERAREHVLEAVEPLGADYRRRLDRFLSERRVDVFPAADKRDVAYCLSAADAGAFVSTQYDGSVRSLFHLAHELGHVMETELRAGERRPLYATTPRPVEEVPSLVHELLLADHLLATGDRPLCEHVRDRLLSTIGGNCFGATRTATFTRECYRIVESGGALSRERLDDVYADVYGEFAPVVDPDPRTPSEWLARPHSRAPYHNYQYVLGIAGAVAVVRSIRSGALAADDYREFLRFGGTKRSVEQFAHLGVDVADAAPYERTIERFEEVLDGIE